LSLFFLNIFNSRIRFSRFLFKLFIYFWLIFVIDRRLKHLLNLLILNNFKSIFRKHCIKMLFLFFFLLFMFLSLLWFLRACQHIIIFSYFMKTIILNFIFIFFNFYLWVFLYSYSLFLWLSSKFFFTLFRIVLFDFKFFILLLRFYWNFWFRKSWLLIYWFWSRLFSIRLNIIFK